MKQTKKAVKQEKSFRLLIKITVCTIYLIVVFILAYCAFHLYKEHTQPVGWEYVQSTNDYTYIDIDKMSEKFARVDGNKDIHFIIDEQKEGIWHIYLLAIDSDDYGKYKKMIDYSYGRTDKKPKSIRVYGYPVTISNELKQLTLKNYQNFVSFENQVELTDENFHEYLTDTYLDSTKEEQHPLNWTVVVLLVLDAILIIVIIVTILDKDRLVDEVDRLVELEKKKNLQK